MWCDQTVARRTAAGGGDYVARLDPAHGGVGTSQEGGSHGGEDANREPFAPRVLPRENALIVDRGKGEQAQRDNAHGRTPQDSADRAVGAKEGAEKGTRGQAGDRHDEHANEEDREVAIAEDVDIEDMRADEPVASEAFETEPDRSGGRGH